MSLRVATLEDFDLVFKLATNFAMASPYKDFYDEDKMKELVKGVIESDPKDSIVILFDDCGMIAGTVHQFLFGTAKIASELAWWVDEDKRGTKAGAELIKGFELWAEMVGCTAITMVCLDDSLSKYYEKQGYKLYERAYMKEIK